MSARNLKHPHDHNTNSDESSSLTSSASPPPPTAKRAKMDTEGMSATEMDPPHSFTGGVVEEDMEQPQDILGNEEEPLEPEPEDSVGDTDPATAQPIITPVELQLLPPIKYEYLDHTADVQIHAWGDNLNESFEQCAMGMFAYITEMERVDNFGSETIEASGHDMLSLLYGFLDEWLFLFNAEPYFVARKIHITSFDRENFKISAIGYGETFNLAKHTQGTEVKAITYSNMQFHEKENYAEVFVIVDI